VRVGGWFGDGSAGVAHDGVLPTIAYILLAYPTPFRYTDMTTWTIILRSLPPASLFPLSLLFLLLPPPSLVYTSSPYSPPSTSPRFPLPPPAALSPPLGPANTYLSSSWLAAIPPECTGEQCSHISAAGSGRGAGE